MSKESRKKSIAILCALSMIAFGTLVTLQVLSDFNPPGCEPTIGMPWFVTTLCEVTDETISNSGQPTYVETGGELRLTHVELYNSELTVRGSGKLYTYSNTNGKTIIHSRVKAGDTSFTRLEDTDIHGGFYPTTGSENTLINVNQVVAETSRFPGQTRTTISASNMDRAIIEDDAEVNIFASTFIGIVWDVTTGDSTQTLFDGYSDVGTADLTVYGTQDIEIKDIGMSNEWTYNGMITSANSNFRIEIRDTKLSFAVVVDGDAKTTIQNTYLRLVNLQGNSINTLIDVTYYGWQQFKTLGNSQNVIDGLIETRYPGGSTGIRFLGSSVTEVRHSKIFLAFFVDLSTTSLSESTIEEAIVCGDSVTVNFGQRQTTIVDTLRIKNDAAGAGCVVPSSTIATISGPVDASVSVEFDSGAQVTRNYPTHVVNLDCVTPQVGAHVEIREGIVVKGFGDTDINGNTDFDIDFDYTNYETKFDVFVGSTQLNRRLGFTTETPFGLTVAPPPEVWVDASIDADDSCNFDTLHEAVDTIASGGTVHVESGSYKGWVTVSRGMEIIGEGDPKPTFTITYSGDAMSIDTDEDVTIDNLRFVSTAPLSHNAVGINVLQDADVIIQSNTFENFFETIVADQGDVIQVLDNNIRAEFDNCVGDPCMHGIRLQGVHSSSVVKGNQLTFNDDAWGINIGSLTTIAEISDNTITKTNPDEIYLGTGESAGIYLQEQSDTACPPTLPPGTLVVTGNVIDGFWWGVSGVGAQAFIKENQIMRVYLGISAASEGHISCMDIEDNVIQDALYNGVQVLVGSYALIKNNLIDDVQGSGSPAGLGVHVKGTADVEYNRISSAQVAGIKVYTNAEANIIGNSIDDSNEGIANEGDVEIKYNQVSRAQAIGIQTFSLAPNPVSSALIEGNFIVECGIAVVSERSDTTIHGNTLFDNNVGIKLTTIGTTTFQRTVTHNRIFDTTESGILIENANPTLGFEDQISWNHIEMTLDPIGINRGISIEISAGTSVIHNTLVGNYYGIYSQTSSGLMINNNDILKSESYGVYLTATSVSRVDHNNFIDNTMGPSHQAFDDGSTNQWDSGYPSGGNYWSDYNGVDLMWGPLQDQPDPDGIGDTPYSIEGGSNSDAYPLMERHPT